MHLCQVWVTTYGKYSHDTAHVNVLLLESVRCRCTQQPLFSALLANMSPTTRILLFKHRVAVFGHWSDVAHHTRGQCHSVPAAPTPYSCSITNSVTPTLPLSKCPAKERLHSSDHNGVDIWKESNLNELQLALSQEWKAWQQWGCSGQVLRGGKKWRMFTCECCLDQMKQWCLCRLSLNQRNVLSLPCYKITGSWRGNGLQV